MKVNKVENIVANGEKCSHDEQFLHLLQYFQKLSAVEAQKAAIFGKGLRS